MKFQYSFSLKYITRYWWDRWALYYSALYHVIWKLNKSQNLWWIQVFLIVTTFVLFNEGNISPVIQSLTMVPWMCTKCANTIIIVWRNSSISWHGTMETYIMTNELMSYYSNHVLVQFVLWHLFFLIIINLTKRFIIFTIET